MLLPRIRQRLPKSLSPELIAAALLLALGAALRLHSLGSALPVIQQDEPAAAYDAWALLHYGIDRNGFSWPVHFVSWGSGQNALYSYLAMPFIALGGLDLIAFRLPMVLSGILSLFLIWKIGERAAGRRFALLLLLLLALSSWHLIASRWGAERNILPFFLLLSVYFLARPDRSRLLIQSLAVIALSLSVYAYGTAYALAPLFLALVLLWLRLNRLADWRRLLILSALAGIVTLPIMLLVAVNSFGWNSIELGPVSIPRYTGPPRYETMNLLFRGDWAVFGDNLLRAAGIILGGGGGLGMNRLPWFGPLPPLAILLGLLGWGAALYQAKVRRDYGIHLLLAFWFTAALLIAPLTWAESVRMNGLWLPALYLIAWGAFLICRHRRVIFYGLAAVYIAYSGVFLYQYLRNYDAIIADAFAFHNGIGPAVQRAAADAAAGGGGIYVAEFPLDPWEPYIYTLFYTQTPPGEYLETRIVAEPNAAFKRNLAYGPFVFVAPWPQQGESHYRRLLQAGGIDLNRVAHYVLPDWMAAELAAAGLVMERYGNYYYAYDPALVATTAAAAPGPLLQIDRPAVSEPPAARAQFDLYQQDNALTYYKQNCTPYDTRERFFLHITPARAADLPAARQPLGFANRDFYFGEHGALYGRNCWAVVPLPDYPIAIIKTGQFIAGKGELWRAEFLAAQ